MSTVEMESMITKLQEWEELAKEAQAEAEAIRDTIKAEMLARETEELTAGRFIIRWTNVLSNRFDTTAFKNNIWFSLHLPNKQIPPRRLRRQKGHYYD